jgi:hypothetical protein
MTLLTQTLDPSFDPRIVEKPAQANLTSGGKPEKIANARGFLEGIPRGDS